MRRLRHAIPRLALAFAVLLPACAPPPRPVCAVAVMKGKPALCMPQTGGDLFVVGLSEGHGWDRGDWVMLDLPREGFDQPVPVAMAVVVEKYADIAKVQVLYQREAKALDGQREAKALDGATARKISKDDRARLGKYVGRISGLDLARVKIDVGAQDKVLEGDVYQVLSPRDHTAIGRVKVTEVGELWACGVVLDKQEAFQQGLDAVWLKNATGDERMPVSILVVNFDPHDAKDAEEAKAGRGFAKDLADSLTRAAGSGGDMKVRYAQEEQVRLGAGDEDGHKEARLVGKRFGADIVVWGSARCDKAACMQPRFTVVEPGRFASTGYRGAEIWVEKDRAGFSFKGEAPGDPMILAAAILGNIAYKAQRYADASYYLGQAMSKNVLRGADELIGRMNLSVAMYKTAQTHAADEQSEKVIALARERHLDLIQASMHVERMTIYLGSGDVSKVRVEQEAVLRLAHKSTIPAVLEEAGLVAKSQGRLEEARAFYEKALDATAPGEAHDRADVLRGLAEVDARQGRLSEARARYEQALKIERQLKNTSDEAYVLRDFADFEAQYGRAEAPRELYRRSADLSHSIFDAESEAGSLASLARFEAQQGQVAAARDLYLRALDLQRKIGNVVDESRTLVSLALLESRNKNFREARERYLQSLGLLHDGGFRALEAGTLDLLAFLEYNQGNPREARELFQKEIKMWQELDDADGDFSATFGLARIDWDEGNRDRARDAWTKALEKATRTGNLQHQALCQDVLSHIEMEQGDFAGARRRETSALALYRKLSMSREADEVVQRLAALAVVEAAVTSKGGATLLADGGVVVLSVDHGSQAESAGLRPGDVLLQYGGSRLSKMTPLGRLIRASAPAFPIALEILRGLQRLTLQVHGGPLGIDTASLPQTRHPKP